MNYALKLYRTRYFQEVVENLPDITTQFVVITHLLSDRPVFLDAIAQIGKIAIVIAIPYSLDPETCQNLEYPVVTPSLAELADSEYLLSVLLAHLDPEKPLVIIEIGGYCASFVHILKEKWGEKFLGVIEDTETGHRQYQKLSSLPCPVVSVARSTLKETEDFLVGNSCLFSTERIIRQAGFLIDGKQALVLGFGKVGRGLAHALVHRRNLVSVYDRNSKRRILALSEGFQIPDKMEALKKANLIFGATGNGSLVQEELAQLNNGSILISCSSKEIEFDLTCIREEYFRQEIFPNFTRFQRGDKYFYMLAQGTPINFLDGAVIGPVLALVQAEMLYGIKMLLNLQGKAGIFEVEETDREMLATLWIQHFSNAKTGQYCYE